MWQLWTDAPVAPRFSLNSDDIKRWLRNAALFFAPALLLALLEVQAGKPMDEVLVSLKLWGINTAIDILRKFLDQPK